jgi:hypothetical protein
VGAGYWLNPETGMCVQVATTHDAWVREWANAENLGLSVSAFDEIIRFPPTALDEIRLVAVRSGLVRIREHRRHVSVQYMAESDRVQPLLRIVVTALHGVGIHPDTWLVVDNLLLHDSQSLMLGQLEKSLRESQS